jgi:RNA polymerase sigma-70 factor (ECF subfamily)
VDDAEAIEKCRLGDAAAFRPLVARYQAEALGHAFALLGNREDAADAVQDTFVEAFRSLATFDVARAFYPWFYVVLRRRCFKYLDGRRRHPLIIDGERLALVASRGDDGHQALNDALWSLSAEDRELVTLKHFDGLTYLELAERLAIPIGTVMSRLYAARQRLRLLLTVESDEARHES